jgi:hypothetical protein
VHRRIACAVALAATFTAAFLAAPSSPAQATEGEGEPALSLRVAPRVVAYAYGRRPDSRARVPLLAGLRAGAEPVELRSTRTSYDEEIRTVWRTAGGDVELPSGSMTSFAGLHRFLRLTITNLATGETKRLGKNTCLNTYESQRSRPDAPATTPYPYDCPFNPYTLGSVQGIQAGWTSNVLGWENPLRLARGKYDVTVAIAPAYAEIFGIDPADVTGTTRVVVKKGDRDNEGRPTPADPRPQPRAAAPTGPATSDTEAVEGPVPNLRSLPAWGIGISPNGKNLTFAATVWNAGDSPLVVDGFRVDGQDEMDAYQYFFDGDGNQTGYQPVGQFHWDPKPSHQHWHFKDFASYTLLREDQSFVARSKKEAFCLANTDFVDSTVPGAAWRMRNDDLGTACGEYGSQSIREVLSSGWGDTYMQFRAGQSFRLEGLPNGVYYISVNANPDGNLVESATGDNRSLRKIILSGQPGARKVEVPQVGIIEEPEGLFGEG